MKAMRGRWSSVTETTGCGWNVIKKKLKRESGAEVLLIKDLNTSIGVEMKC